mgnify:CR=1 FL=1
MDFWPATHLTSAILNTIFSIFIIFVYVKSKFFHTYAYYFNILFTLVICIRNLLRLIQKEGDESGFCYFQAFVLSTFDKFIQLQITSYSIINYIGMFKNQFFKNNQKRIFIFLTAFSLLYSLVLSMIFISQGLSGEAYCCYVKTSSKVKRVLDTISSVLLLATNLFCTISIIYTLCKSRNNESNNMKRNAIIKRHLSRFITEIIFVSLIFMIVIFTVNKIFTSEVQKEFKEITYELLLLIMEIFYTMNREIFKEIKRIFLCQKVNEDIKDDNENCEDDPDAPLKPQ